MATSDRGWHPVYAGNVCDGTITVVDGGGSGLARTEEPGGLGYGHDLTVDLVPDCLHTSFARSQDTGLLRPKRVHQPDADSPG